MNMVFGYFILGQVPMKKSVAYECFSVILLEKRAWIAPRARFSGIATKRCGVSRCGVSRCGIRFNLSCDFDLLHMNIAEENEIISLKLLEGIGMMGGANIACLE